MSTAISTVRSAVVNPLRPYIESALLVAVWGALGWLFGMSPEAYIVLGVPLVGLFQIFVRRRPLRELWIREPDQPFRLDARGIVIALALMVAPVYFAITAALPQRLVMPPSQFWAGMLFFLCVMAGAVLAVDGLRNQRLDALRRGLPSFGAALLVGFGLQAVDPLLAGQSIAVPLAKIPFMFQKFLLYFAASFLLEEVAFRGALDPHVYPPGQAGNRARAWVSALFVSAVWGLWHLPIAGALLQGDFLEILVIVLVVHIAEGIPLSFCWRQGGTLVLPAIAHALIDAYRDSFLM